MNGNINNTKLRLVITLATRALVPGYRHKLELRWDTGYSKYHLVLEFKVEPLYPEKGTVLEFSWEHLKKKKVFTLVPGKNRTQAPCFGIKCKRSLTDERFGYLYKTVSWSMLKRQNEGLYLPFRYDRLITNKVI